MVTGYRAARSRADRRARAAVWGARADALDRPDLIVFDLDPAEDVEWSTIVAAAYLIKQHVEGLGLRAFLRLAGGKGLHVVVPVVPSTKWSSVKKFARAVANEIVREAPRRFTASMAKSQRGGESSSTICATTARRRAGCLVLTACAVPARLSRCRSNGEKFDRSAKSAPRYGLLDVPSLVRRRERETRGRSLRTRAAPGSSLDGEACAPLLGRRIRDNRSRRSRAKGWVERRALGSPPGGEGAAPGGRLARGVRPVRGGPPNNSTLRVQGGSVGRVSCDTRERGGAVLRFCAELGDVLLMVANHLALNVVAEFFARREFLQRFELLLWRAQPVAARTTDARSQGRWLSPRSTCDTFLSISPCWRSLQRLGALRGELPELRPRPRCRVSAFRQEYF